MTDDHDHESELLVPFVVCASNDGPYDDDAYAAGWEAGKAWADLEYAAYECVVVPDALVVRTANVPMLDLIAMHHGYTMTVEAWEEHPDEWSRATFRRADLRG